MLERGGPFGPRQLKQTSRPYRQGLVVMVEEKKKEDKANVAQARQRGIIAQTMIDHVWANF